ncbi:protein-methionine-sulfoxide reductase catalytic subunit MsrP [Rhodopirellula sp.]|jgi:sulfoxide reductase catalytic subunit YedY|nr:protein-methionine-sulfoxide reductase catalytic subunit MsrP [Rhodopirellula sp.]
MNVTDDPITPPELYLNRRAIMRSGAVAASAATTALMYRWFNPATKVVNDSAPLANLKPSSEISDPTLRAGWETSEEKTPESDVIGYNNFYEFTTDKRRVAAVAQNFRTAGWQITIDGLVEKPRKLSIDQIHDISPPEERVYRMRCVEAWSMVIPWAGVPLHRILETVSPMPDAKYVAFETLLDPEQMPGQKTNVLEWPYVEGLRLDEAMHPLTLMATGLYGKHLPAQDGAPIRLVVPWKYGFKGIKSIVRITLVDQEPATSWNRYAPSEYGFYANVNPAVDHPRWSQATEQRIGETVRRKTRLFNGYEEQVAELYTDMDLRRFF